MGIYTQQQEGYGRTIISVYSLCGCIMSNFLIKWSDAFSPVDHNNHPALPTMHIPTRTVPLPPTKTIYVPPTPSTPSALIQIAVGMCIFLFIGLLMAAHVMYVHSRPTSPDDSSQGDHREHGGDGDDYPSDGASDEADNVDEEIEDALSPFEDPPPPPDPPSQTAAADPDSTPRSIPTWLLIFILLFSTTTISLVLKHSINRVRRVLGRIKVYTGRSILRLFVYIQDPGCALEWAVHQLCHALDWVKVYTGGSILDPTIYIMNSSYHAVAHTAVSSFTDVEQIVAPIQPQNSDMVRPVAQWNITKLFTAYILPVMPKIWLIFGVSSLGVLVNLWWHSGESITQHEEARYVADRQDIIVVQTDVEIPLIAGTDIKQQTTTQTDADDFMDVIGFLFDLRLIFLNHQTTSPGALLTLTTAAIENITLPPPPSVSEEISTSFVDESFSSIGEDEAYVGTSSANHRVLLTPATVAVDVRESDVVESVTAPCWLSASLPCFIDEVLPAAHEQDAGHTSEEDDDDVLFHSLPDASLVVPVEVGIPFAMASFVDSDGAEMVSIEGGSGSYIEEVIEERAEEKKEDSERTDPKAPLGIRHGEHGITDTPSLAPTSGQASDIGRPAIPLPSSLPKRVQELRRSFRSRSPLRQGIIHSAPKQTITPHHDTTSPYSAMIVRLFDLLRAEFITPPDATPPSEYIIGCRRLLDTLLLDVVTPPDGTPPSDSMIRCMRLFDKMRLEFSSVSESSGSRLPSVAEAEQPTPVEADAGFLGKADVPLSKPHIVVEAEGIAAGCEPCPAGLAELVDERSVWEDPEVVLESDVVTVAAEEPFVELPNSVVEEKLLEALHSSTFTPTDEAPIGSQELDGEDSSPIDFVDGADVYRSIIPLTIDGPAIPTSTPQPIYCSCCPGMELEWDVLSMVDDVVAELQCYSLPHGMDELIELVAQGDLHNVVAKGIDLQMWGCDFIVIDADDEAEEVEGSYYEEEDALWIHHSDEVDEDEEDEEEDALVELLSGLFNEPIHRRNDNHEEVGEERHPRSTVTNCHDENARRQHYGDVSSDLSAVLDGPDDIHDVFGPKVENVSRSRDRETASIEDSPEWMFCPQASSSLVLEVPPTFTPDPLKLGQESRALPVEVCDVFGLTVENTFGSGRRGTAPIEDGPERSFCPPPSSSPAPEVPPTSTLNPLKIGAHADVLSDVVGAEEKQRTWPLRRVMRESMASQNQEDPHRWQLRPVSPTRSPGPPEVNELQRMRAALRRPSNMTDQEKRLRQVWELHGTEKGRALKERHLRRTGVVYRTTLMTD